MSDQLFYVCVAIPKNCKIKYVLAVNPDKEHVEYKCVIHSIRPAMEKKMVQAEILNLLNQIDSNNKPINQGESNYVLLKKLEALGLIEFEKEKPFKETFKYAKNEGDVTFLTWLYSRLINIHGEAPNKDYMLTLKRFINEWESNS